jgi:hypothetical protein
MTKNTDESYTFTMRAADPDVSGNFTDTYIDLLSETSSPSAVLTGQEKINSLIDSLISKMTDDWNSSSFVSPTFNMWVNNYRRDDDGDLYIESSSLLQDIPSTNLKTYWSGKNELLSIATTGFWGPWNDPGAGAWPETVPYPTDFEKASIQAIRSQANTYVGEINAQLQQYIQTAQARKSNIDNAMKTMQNLLSQTMQATTNQANLLDAILQSLKSILTSIFH